MSAGPRIIITGANGFVGAELTQAVVRFAPSAEVIAVGGHDIPRLHVGGVELSMADLTKQEDAERVGKMRPDIIVHLAARSSVAASEHSASETVEANLAATIRLAQAVRRYAPGATFIFASSAEVYGASFLEGIANESTPLQPRNAYGRSKAAAEYALSDILAGTNPLVVLRLFNHTGPGQREGFVIPSFAAQIARIEHGKAVPILKVGNLESSREFLDIRDVISAYLRIIGAAADGHRTTETYNISSGSSLTIRSVVDKLLLLSRTPITVEIDELRLRASDIPVATGDATRFCNNYSWAPQIPISNTLAAVLGYWRSQVSG